PVPPPPPPVVLLPAPVPPPPPETHTSGDGSYRGERVRVHAPGSTAKVRATPAGTTLGTQPHSAIGTIVDGGVYGASTWGYGWWKVNFDSGLDGWVAATHNTGNTAFFLLQKLDGSSLNHPAGATASVHCPFGIVSLTGALGDEFGNKGLRGQQLAYKESHCYSIRVTEPKDFLVVGTDNELAVGIRVIGDIGAELIAPNPQAVATDGDVGSQSSYGNFNGGEVVVRATGGGKVPAGEYILRIERTPVAAWVENGCASGFPNAFYCSEKQKFGVYWRQEDRITTPVTVCPMGYEEFSGFGGTDNNSFYGKGKNMNGDGEIKLPFGQTQKYCAKNVESINLARFQMGSYDNYQCNSILLKVSPPRGSGVARVIDISTQPTVAMLIPDRALSLGVWLVEIAATTDTFHASPDCIASYAAVVAFSTSTRQPVPPPPPAPVPPPPPPAPQEYTMLRVRRVGADDTFASAPVGTAVTVRPVPTGAALITDNTANPLILKSDLGVNAFEVRVQGPTGYDVDIGICRGNFSETGREPCAVPDAEFVDATCTAGVCSAIVSTQQQKHTKVVFRYTPIGVQPPPPPPPASLTLGIGAPIRIKALPESTAGANYRNDPLPDGSCGTPKGEELVGARGTVIGARNVCTTDGRRRWKIRFTSGAEGWVTQNRLEVVSPTSFAPSASDPAIANTLDGLRRSIENLQNLINQH
ncbi:MAG: hypothetical protein AAB417_03855, partial [Patescibacteria group bacterium]